MRKISFGSVQSAGACPLCKSPMRERIARRGPNRGQRFLGCARWPQCAHIVNFDEPDGGEARALSASRRLGFMGLDERDLADGAFPFRDDWGW